MNRHRHIPLRCYMLYEENVYIPKFEESKEHLIKQFGFFPDQEEELIKLSNKYPQQSAKINWGRDNLTYEEIKNTLISKSFRKVKRKMKRGRGMKEGRDYLSFEDGFIISPLTYEATCYYGQAPNSNGSPSPWVVSAPGDDIHFKDYYNKEIYLFFVYSNMYKQKVMVAVKRNGEWEILDNSSKVFEYGLASDLDRKNNNVRRDLISDINLDRILFEYWKDVDKAYKKLAENKDEFMDFVLENDLNRQMVDPLYNAILDYNKVSKINVENVYVSSPKSVVYDKKKFKCFSSVGLKDHLEMKAFKSVMEDDIKNYDPAIIIKNLKKGFLSIAINKIKDYINHLSNTSSKLVDGIKFSNHLLVKAYEKGIIDKKSLIKTVNNSYSVVDNTFLKNKYLKSIIKDTNSPKDVCFGIINELGDNSFKKLVSENEQYFSREGYAEDYVFDSDIEDILDMSGKSDNYVGKYNDYHVMIVEEK